MPAINVKQALNLGQAYHRVGQLTAAQGFYRQILVVDPDCAEAWNLLGTACRLTGSTQEAIDCFRKALAIQPSFSAAHSNLGEVLSHLGLQREAINHLERAVELTPNDASTQSNLGMALAQSGQYEAALSPLRTAITIDPGCAPAYNNLGNTYRHLYRWDDAISAFNFAITLRPRFVEAHTSRALALMERAQFEAAISDCRTAIDCDPTFAEPHFNLALLLLLLGHSAEGWSEYEWRLRRGSSAVDQIESLVPRWNGLPSPTKTILVRTEQGFGDIIHFLRYLPLVRDRSGGARIVFACQPEFLRLVRSSPLAGIESISCETAVDAVPFRVDLQIPLLSIPLALGQYDPLRMASPYVCAADDLRIGWRSRLGDSRGLRVGLAWAGRRTHGRDHQRSITPEQLLPVLAVPGARFYSLQIESCGAVPPALLDVGLIDATGHLTDFADTAAFIATLDLIISVDTAVAHLAGAMGKPVWTLLPFVPDWRWGLKREDTPWYPTMRLFRRPAIGDWASVIQRVVDELQRIAAA